MTENECLIHPIYRKRTKKRNENIFFSPCIIWPQQKIFFWSCDGDDEAVASPLAIMMMMLKMMRPVHPLWPATVAVQTWKYSGQSEARPTSPSPRSPSPPHSLTSQTCLNLPMSQFYCWTRLTVRVGHRLPHVVRHTFRYPIYVILTSQNLHLDKMASWHLKKGAWSAIPGSHPSFSAFVDSGHWTASA